MKSKSKSNRLEGLDVARYLAFVGMVIVNFSVAMGAESSEGLLAIFTGTLEGRAAATFVILAGVGLGLSSVRGLNRAISVTVKRSIFLLVVGLLNMLIFDADILHYYAFYFLLGVLFLPLNTRSLFMTIIGLNIAFVVMILVFNYDIGWNWEELSYEGFWTIEGFMRNLFFNGWHPVIPWLGFLLFGVVLSRLDLANKFLQNHLIIYGVLVLLVTELLSMFLQPLLAGIDVQLSELVTTEPVPPMPLYTMAGMGAGCVVIGMCLRFSDKIKRIGLLRVVTPAGRQTLTLYIAHILMGMGTLEALGMLENQTAEVALIASLVFSLCATLYALLWSRFFRRGPVEALMRTIAG